MLHAPCSMLAIVLLLSAAVLVIVIHCSIPTFSQLSENGKARN
jgi:hypothetical protein